MFPTPKYEITDESVYPPSEDTFILLDALESELQVLQLLSPQIVLEIGSGSGVVSTFIQTLLQDPTLFSFCIDLNPKALECTQRTLELNEINPCKVDLVRSNLVDALILRQSVDVLLFNPPYVPSEKPANCNENFYFAGGENGRVFVDLLLPRLNSVLSSKGVFYLVALRQNNIEDIRKRAAMEFGFATKIVLERWCGIEYLYVMKFWRNCR